MLSLASSLTFRQKSAAAEWFFLGIINILIPMAMGYQIWRQWPFTLCLILLTSMQTPAIILLYRFILPVKNKLWLAILLPLYVVVYEINARLAYVVMLALPFIPQGYRENLLSANPTNLSHGWIQNFGYTILIMLSTTAVYFAKAVYKNQHSLFELKTAQLKLELDHLKSQVQPHFFFNTLNNLYALAVQGSPKTPTIIADLSSIMRYVLYNTQQEKVHLQQEIDFIKSYIQLENVRHDDPQAIEFLIQGEPGTIEIEPLLFLPLIENAFKHSLQRNLNHKWVKLVLAMDEDELTFQTSNPAPEQPSPTSHQGGIGLSNVRKRLQLLYPNGHQLTIHKADGIFTVTLTIQRTRA